MSGAGAAVRDTVETVCGPVALADLGRTLMHEHTTIVWPGAEQDYRRSPPRAQLDTVVAQLTLSLIHI